MRVENSDYIAQRIAEGGYGPEKDDKLASALHRFIYEYDDLDPVRSAWFLHRLELVLNEAKAAEIERLERLWAKAASDLMCCDSDLATMQARVAELERSESDLMTERDTAQDAITATHLALGGDGEWVCKCYPVEPPETGDLHFDVPALAAAVLAERDDARAEAEALRADAERVDSVIAAHCADLERCIPVFCDYGMRRVADEAAVAIKELRAAREGGE